MRRFLSREVPYQRRNRRYSVSQMLLALVYPIVLGLDRIEAASFLRSNGTFQYLTGLPGFPDPQTLRRFLLNAPPSVWEHLYHANDQLLRKFIHLPDRRSRLIFDLDSTVVTAFGKQDGAELQVWILFLVQPDDEDALADLSDAEFNSIKFAFEDGEPCTREEPFELLKHILASARGRTDPPVLSKNDPGGR